MKKLLLIPLASLGLLVNSASAANLLLNPGFETGDMTGWTINNGVIGQPGIGAQSGAFSTLLTIDGDGVPEINQSFVATPGQQFNFSGYMMTPAALPGGPSFGVLKIVFRNATDVDLPVIASPGDIGTINNTFPGMESGQVNSASPVNQWLFLEAQATAPANTAKVLFLALNVEFNPGNHSIYGDSFQASLVPEPASAMMAGLGTLALLIRRRRR
jgi:hypothetical protein